jgi:hypothetical protein
MVSEFYGHDEGTKRVRGEIERFHFRRSHRKWYARKCTTLFILALSPFPLSPALFPPHSMSCPSITIDKREEVDTQAIPRRCHQGLHGK